MFCPICKAEYREGFTRCSDCDIELIAKLEDEIPVEEFCGDEFDEENFEGEFVELLRTSDITDIAQIKGILDSANIRYFIQGENMLAIRPLDCAVLKVVAEDAEKAMELIQGIKLNFYRFKFKKH